jgi:hypothetical protein
MTAGPKALIANYPDQRSHCAQEHPRYQSPSKSIALFQVCRFGAVVLSHGSLLGSDERGGINNLFPQTNLRCMVLVAIGGFPASKCPCHFVQSEFCCAVALLCSRRRPSYLCRTLRRQKKPINHHTDKTISGVSNKKSTAQLSGGITTDITLGPLSIIKVFETRHDVAWRLELKERGHAKGNPPIPCPD